MFALSKKASPGVAPVALMRLTEIKDPDELLKEFDRDDVVIEEKLDGWKIQVIKTNGKIHIYSRRGEEKTENFPELVKALDFLPNETLVEGELVYWEKNKQDVGKVTSLAGSSSEKAIEKAKELPGTLKIHLYDVLWNKGKKVADRPFSERRKILEGIVKQSEKIKLTKTYSFADWQKAMNTAVDSGGEGIVLKLKDKPYKYKSKGETEPKPPKTMFKFKGGAGKSDSDDYVVFDYEITEKDKLKVLYGQYYKGKLYYMSEISNFSKEDEEKIKNKLKKGNFVIEIGFQERQPGGLRHQKFLRFRDDKKSKDATMNEFHVKHIDNFEVASKKEAADVFLLPIEAQMKFASYVDTIIQRLEKFLGIESVPGKLGNVGGVDSEKMFRVMSQLESGGKAYVIGDSGTSFGPTQVHGPYFMGMLSKMPHVQTITGISPREFKKMSADWKRALAAVRRKNIWDYQRLDSETIKKFVKEHPKSRVVRAEGTFIRYRPDMVVLEKGGKYIGKTLKPEILKQLGNSPAVRRAVQKLFTTYITDNVARSKLAEIIVSKGNYRSFAKFKNRFSSRNIRRNKTIRNLVENTSRQDFMNKIRATTEYVKRSGYDTTAPNAYNIYQLIVIANASGPGRLKQFLFNKKTFGPGHLHYLQSSRVRKELSKMSKMQPDLAPITNSLLESIPPKGGMGGFSSRVVAELFISKKAYEEEEFQEENTKEIIVDPAQREMIGELYSKLNDEFAKNPALKEQARKEYEEIYNKEINDNEFIYYLSEEIANFVLNNWETLKEKQASDVSLSKRAMYSEPGALYFPAQYIDAIKSGKRRMTIRTNDIPVSVEEVVKCRTYGGAYVCDLLITSKERMSGARIEKAFGKNVSKALERRFGPNKRYMVIRFDVYEGVQPADDGDDQEKMSEVLIDKDGVKLTRGQIKSHYEKPEVRKKIMSRIKDKPVLVYIGVGKNQKILKRNHNGKEIKITNDDPNNSEDVNNYFYWVKRRVLSFHQVFGSKTDLGFVDLDIHGNFPLEKAKKYAKALAKKLKAKYGSTPTIYQSGGTGLHVEFKLSKEMGIDKLRAELKTLLDEFNEDWENVKTGLVKGNGMRSDISTLHNKGSIRMPGSFNESYGKIKKPLGGKQDDEDQFSQSYGKKYTMLPENLDKDPGGLDTGAIPFFPTKGVDFTSGVGSYFDANDKTALYKTQITKEAGNKKILMLVSPEEFCETEYTIPHDLFVEKFKFDVKVVSSDTKAKGNRGTIIETGKISEMNAGDFDALFVVGGMGMVSYSKDKGAQKLLKSFVRQKKPVAMICHAPLLAAEAGVMRGREITGWPEIMGKVRRSKGVWTGLPIEKDGSLFTAIGPDDSENFAWVFANFLNGEKTLGPAKQKYEAWLKASDVLERIEKFAAELNEDEEKLKKRLREEEIERLREEQTSEKDEMEEEEEELRPRKLPSEKEKVEMFGERMKPYRGTYEEFEAPEEEPEKVLPGEDELAEFIKWRREKEERGLLKDIKQPFQEFLKEKKMLKEKPEEIKEEEDFEEIPEEEDWEEVSNEEELQSVPKEEGWKDVAEKEDFEEVSEEEDWKEVTEKEDFDEVSEEEELQPVPEEEIPEDISFEEEELEEIEYPEDEEEEEEDEELKELKELISGEREHLERREEIAKKEKEIVPPSVREITEKQKHAIKMIIDKNLSEIAERELEKLNVLNQEELEKYLNESFVRPEEVETADIEAQKGYNRIMSGFELYSAVPGKMGEEISKLKDSERFEELMEEVVHLMLEDEEEAEKEESDWGEDIENPYSIKALQEEAEKLKEAKPYFAPKLEVPRDEKGAATWKEPNPPTMSQEAFDFFTPEKMESGPEFRKLLNDPKAWKILKREPHLLQKWILPFILRSIGRMWFIRNCGRLNEQFGTLPNTPFGMFSDVDEKRARKLRNQELDFEDQPEAKSYIHKIIEKTTDLANKYFSEDRVNIDPMNMDKWIYKILDRQMIKEVAKDKGYVVSKAPVCSVCKTIESLPPRMEKSKKRSWRCPSCAKRLEDSKKIDLPSIESKINVIMKEQQEANKALKGFSNAMDTYTDPKDKEEVGRKIRDLNRLLTSNNERVEGLLQEKKDIERKISIYSAQSAVPWSHTWCPNPTCPGGRVPLNSVDWNHHIWKTEKGKKIKDKLKRYYGIVPPMKEEKEQEAKDKELPSPPEGEGRAPPSWLDEVPLICPHDGIRFTIGQARKEKRVPSAGFLWGPYTRDIWTTVEKEHKGQQIPQQIEPDTQQDIIIHFKEWAPFAQNCATRQYYNFYDELSFLKDKIEGGEEKPLSNEAKKSALRKLFLLSATKDYSFDDPLSFVGWMSGAMLGSEIKKNKDGNVLNKRNQVQRLYNKQEVSIPLLQRWIDKMLSVENPYETFGLDKWLVNMKRDGVSSDGPGTYFVAKIEEGLKLSRKDAVPLGAKFNIKGKEVRQKRKGTTPRLLRVLNIWNLNDSDLGQLEPEQIAGLEAIPKWKAEKIIADKEENISGMLEHNYDGIELTTKTNQFTPDKYIIVRALVMPGKYDWSPIKMINELENNKIGADFWDKFRELVVHEKDNPEFWARFRKQMEKTMKDYPYKIEDILEMELFRAQGRKKAQLKLAKDPLSKYKNKRDEDETPEPEGKVEKGKNKHRFVIQKHDAKVAKTHYDLRLENDEGTMTSWAIPKHKLPKGKEKLLAMKTEDHPLSYRTFSGTIPEGEYGAGKVSIHDSGIYEEIEWGKNKIVFKLNGKKEKGKYKIFRTDGSKWMIMEANKDDLEKKGNLLSIFFKGAAKYTEEEYKILLQSARERRKLFRIMKREQEKLRKLGIEPVCVSSTAAGINVPGVSDIDFQVGTDDVEETSKMLTEAGIPFSNVREGAYVEHTYETPEGISIDLKVRPKSHVRWQMSGLKRILEAPQEERYDQILKKYEAIKSGDKDKYKQVKYDLYRKYLLHPPKDDWSLVEQEIIDSFLSN